MAQQLTLPREVRDALDLHDARVDPAAFFLAAFRSMAEPLREIANRTARRARLRSVVMNDGPRRKRIRVRIRRNDAPAIAAAKFAVIASRRPDLLADETLRFTLGQPMGPRGLDEMIDPRIAAGMAPRHFLPIIVGVVVPLLCAVLPAVLPMIIQWGKDAFHVEGPADPNAAVVDDVGDEADDEWFGYPKEYVLAAGGIAAVAIIMIWKR